MNQYAFFSLIAAFICVAVGVSVFQRAEKKRLYSIFLVSCVAITQWALVGFGLSQADSFEEASWWAYLYKLWPMTMAIFLHFFVVVLDREGPLRAVYFQPVLYGTAVVVTVVEFSTDLITGAPYRVDWGFALSTAATNPIQIASYGWFFAICAALLYFMVRYGLLSGNSKRRKQTALFLIGISFPFTAGICEAAFYLHGDRLPPLSSALIAFGALFFGYGIWKHDLLDLSPVRAAHEIVSTMADCVLIADPKGTIASANRAALHLLGYSEEELTGSPVERILVKKDALREQLFNMTSDGTTNTDLPGDLEVFFQSRPGAEIPVSLSIAVLRTARGKPRGFILIGRDISRRKREEAEKKNIEQQLVHAQKIEAIGRLAGGVAHDMNNVLAMIVGTSANLSDDIESGNAAKEQLLESIDALNVACKRGSDLTRNLLGFARKGKYVKQQFCLNDAAAQVKALLEHTAPKQIEIKSQLTKDLHRVQGDRSQIEHALLNICLNAIDAISDYGTLTLETDNVACSPEIDARFNDIEPGDYVRIRITDTGGGIEPGLKEKVFEPFFTTKERGEGTGLGLPMVFGAVKNHLGTVKLNSVLGLGTSVEIYLPAIASDEKEQDVEAERPRISRPSSQSRSVYAAEGILVVDDEEMIRRSVSRLLKKRGYTVFQAEDGSEAVALYSDKQPEISLVILDLVMPGLDGSGTFSTLKELNPNVKVVLHSGYSQDERVDEILAAGAKAFLPKPCDPDRLFNTIAEVLSPPLPDHAQTQH